MKNNFRLRILLSFIALLFLMHSASSHVRPAIAQSGGGYDLTWNTIDGGGATSAGGAYSLSGTVGQPDAGVMSGGAYTLSGGFWVDFLGYPLYLPLILR